MLFPKMLDFALAQEGNMLRLCNFAKFWRYPRPPTPFTESQNVTNTPDPNAKDTKCTNQNTKHYNENTKYTKD